ncbi:MAG: cell division protein ZapE [Pseudomonadota bacterium]
MSHSPKQGALSSELGSTLSTTLGPVAARVAELVEAGTLTHDPAQTSTITALDAILARLAAPPLANKKSSLGWLFAGKKSRAVPADGDGAYIYGGVGRGKTMLMDLFFEQAPAQPKRRVHFHAFMQDVHGRIHGWRQAAKSRKARPKDKTADPIPPLADALAKEAQLLCFDEFAVTDVADAMILARLFTGLFERGVTVVATSNVAPDDLYKNGLNRSFFLPFIDLIKTRMRVEHLASVTDYRMARLANEDAYMVGSAGAVRFDGLWSDLTRDITVSPAQLEVKGRVLTFAHAAGGLLRTDFDTLCAQALGSGDYLAITARFHTLFLESVPIMGPAQRNEAKRFIALIDTLYDAGAVLICQAEAAPDGLYPVAHGTEAFEFARTISRLQEMQSKPWLAAARSRA